MKRTYEVTAKFKISGNVPSFIEEEHIKGKIEGKLEEMSIALHGEYYGDIDEEWEMYVDEGAKVRLVAKEL
jgi:hypothetical protein